MEGASPKGIKANGKKIRELRLKSGKSQKALIQDSQVQLRTYQRAEKGEHISSDLLQQIARLFNIGVDEIRGDDRKSAPSIANSFRLYNLHRVGGRKLYRELQQGCSKLRISFQLDPGSKLAEKIAEAVTLIERYHATEHEQITSEPSWQIREIGILNDLGVELADLGISVFFGSYNRWQSEKSKHQYECLNGDKLVAHAVGAETIIQIVFSQDQAEFVMQSFPSYYSYESALEFAVKKNLELGIPPEWFDEHGFDFFDGFCSSYRAAWDKEHPALPPLALVHDKGGSK